MEIYSTCVECMDQDKDPVCVKGELNREFSAVCTCPDGHNTIAMLWQNPFDVLYTSAVSAFLKGFYSESIMSFTAALEKTYEFFIKTTLHAEGLNFESIDDFWKEIKRSERQFGAFCTQYFRINLSSILN